MSELAELRKRVAELETREAELERLKERLARLATFPEQNPNPVIETNLEGQVTYLNPAARERFPDLHTAGLHHPILEGLESIIHTLEERKEDSSLRELEIEDYIYQQKTTYMAQNNLVRIYAHDVTELKRAEETLARLATFPEQNPNPVIETNLEGQVTYLNPAAKGRFPDLRTAGHQHPILEGLESIIHTLEERKEDSSLRELEIEDCIYQQKTTYMAQNNLVRIYAHDITELKLLQKQLQESLTELEQTNKSLQETQVQLVQSEKMAALGGLVAGIAHEINTPVGIGVTAASHLDIQNRQFLDLYRDGKMKRSDLTKFLDTVDQSSQLILSNLNRAAEIIGSFKQVAVDQSSEERREFKVKEYLDEILLNLKPELKKTNHEIRVECDESITLDTYPGAFSQIVTNLVMNSMIHAYGKADVGLITLDLVREPSHLIFKYADDGKGIPEQHLAKIFDPFFSTRRNQGGSGLGMHIVYNLVTQRLNGTIALESQIGVGTTFTIELPFSEVRK